MQRNFSKLKCSKSHKQIFYITAIIRDPHHVYSLQLNSLGIWCFCFLCLITGLFQLTRGTVTRIQPSGQKASGPDYTKISPRTICVLISTSTCGSNDAARWSDSDSGHQTTGWYSGCCPLIAIHCYLCTFFSCLSRRYIDLDISPFYQQNTTGMCVWGDWLLDIEP